MACRQPPVRGPDLPKDNSLRGRSLRLSDIKLRLLGHWGTTPGLNFLSVHLNRLIKGNWRRIRRHRLYISEHGPDLPEILNRRWCANA